MRHRPLLSALAIAGLLGAADPDDVELSCPPGTTLQERGTEFACETPEGVGEGPFWLRRADGTLRVWGRARDGMTEGRWLQWHPSGGKSIEATYRKGELVGSYQMWNEQGQLVYAGTHDANGEMDGTWTRWWPNGERRAQWVMRHGRAHGTVESFWADGEKRFEGRRENGRRAGEWIWWDEADVEVARCRYEDDAVVEGVCGEAGAP